VIDLGTFPFGQPVRPLTQLDRVPKEIFVLGVYASAVHARWIGPDGTELAKALAVASEPHIFWRGDDAMATIGKIYLPPGAGRLTAAASMFNGPSGIALDELFLAPLGRTREQAWLADLVPHSCVNAQQQAALDRCYLPRASEWRLPPPSVPSVPSRLADVARQDSIAAELLESRARVLILLGDQPIRWFSSRWLTSHRRLADFGTDAASYGRLTEATIAGAKVALLPLAHPRQVARLGRSSDRWQALHREWIEGRASALF
jgi:uracil-DNA glycosylase